MYCGFLETTMRHVPHFAMHTLQYCFYMFEFCYATFFKTCRASASSLVYSAVWLCRRYDKRVLKCPKKAHP